MSELSILFIGVLFILFFEELIQIIVGVEVYFHFEAIPLFGAFQVSTLAALDTRSVPL